MNSIRPTLLSVILLLFMQISFAQVPANDLGKSVSQMRQSYPGMQYSQTRDKLVEYSAGSHTLTFKNDRLVCDCVGAYASQSKVKQLLAKLEQTSYKSKSSPSDDNISFTQMFYYDGFWITVGYWYSDSYLNYIYQSPDYFK